MKTKPTDLPAGYRRTVLVTGIPIPSRPTTETGVLRAAARLIVANGHHQGDYLPDPFNRQTTTAHHTRPLCIAAAIRCAVSGDPHRQTALSERVIVSLAARLLVDGEGPYAEDAPAAEWHLAKWGDFPGRSAASVVSVLEVAADAAAVTL